MKSSELIDFSLDDDDHVEKILNKCSILYRDLELSDEQIEPCLAVLKEMLPTLKLAEPKEHIWPEDVSTTPEQLMAIQSYHEAHQDNVAIYHQQVCSMIALLAALIHSSFKK